MIAYNPRCRGKKACPSDALKEPECDQHIDIGCKAAGERAAGEKDKRNQKNSFYGQRYHSDFPASGMAMQTPIENIEIVHPAQRTSVCKSLMKLGKATATAVASMVYMRRPK